MQEVFAKRDKTARHMGGPACWQKQIVVDMSLMMQNWVQPVAVSEECYRCLTLQYQASYSRLRSTRRTFAYPIHAEEKAGMQEVLLSPGRDASYASTIGSGRIHTCRVLGG